jgi:outer membrane lipoprotein-sorting protein
MRRRSLLALAALPAGPAAAQAPDRAGIVAAVERHLNSLTTLRARFLQIAQNGASAEGTALLWRPGRMRFDYDPPEPLLLIAAHNQFFQYDRELRSPTTVPVGSTPLGFLLRDPIRLAGDITVSAAERAGGFLRVTMHRAGQAAEGRLSLVFEENPMQLRQWAVVDAQARETRVTLTQIETGLRFDPRLFEFNDPRFLEWEAERARRR